MNIGIMSRLVAVASADEAGNIEVLKKELRDNGFKLCGMGVSLMLGQMRDRGMSEDCAAYWESIGMLHLPYEPSKALAS